MPVADALPNIDLIREDFGRCKFTDKKLVAMIRFFAGNVWFSRVWTLQEMLLARQTEFICRSVIAPLEVVWKGSLIVMLFSAASSIYHDICGLPEFGWPKMFTVAIDYH